MSAFSKWLPPGNHMRVNGLLPGTTEEEIQKVIKHRTGILVPLDRIAVTTQWTRDSAVLLSVDGNFFADLLTWALSEDSLAGRPLRFVKPSTRRLEEKRQ